MRRTHGEGIARFCGEGNERNVSTDRMLLGIHLTLTLAVASASGWPTTPPSSVQLSRGVVDGRRGARWATRTIQSKMGSRGSNVQHVSERWKVGLRFWITE